MRAWPVVAGRVEFISVFGVKVPLFPSSLKCLFVFPLKAFRTLECVYIYMHLYDMLKLV